MFLLRATGIYPRSFRRPRKILRQWFFPLGNLRTFRNSQNRTPCNSTRAKTPARFFSNGLPFSGERYEPAKEKKLPQNKVHQEIKLNYNPLLQAQQPPETKKYHRHKPRQHE